ncbi:MAG: DsrE family protein [Oscillospiraceae bacterium]|nr:DsrE family protein [Oscillospiraceae bacterium]
MNKPEKLRQPAADNLCLQGRAAVISEAETVLLPMGAPALRPAESGGGKTLLIIGSVSLGADNLPSEASLGGGLAAAGQASGVPGLGEILQRRFLHALRSVTRKPAALLFINSGVRLLAAQSPVHKTLLDLSEQGINLYACQESVYSYHIDAIKKTELLNSIGMAELMLNMDKVVTLPCG